MGDRPEVAVVVPAYNAGHVIGETLRSISAQTFHRFEIVVVDDGSSDDTVEVVGAYALEEPRLRLVQQQNGGVAAARNRGLMETEAPIVAPVDSDDLWHPTRLEKHVAALNRNPAAAFAYSPFRILNGHGRIIGNHPFFAFSGRVFYRQLFFNMVGNGSGMTFRRDVALRHGGYSPQLRAAGLEGCEDWLLQMLMSIEHEVEHVPEYLIGYRKVPGAMSSDTSRMWRSRIMASEMLKAQAPLAARQLIDSAELSFSMRLALQELRKGDLRQLLGAVGTAFTKGLATQLPYEIHDAIARSRSGRTRRTPPGAFFLEIDPKTMGPDYLTGRTRRLIERLRLADESPAIMESDALAMRVVGALAV